jgi:hypothetical protein
LWNDVLVPISGQKDVTTSLERQLIIRQFNIRQLGMEDTSSGSDMEKIIGVGKRIYRPTGELIPVVDFFYSHFRRIVRTFEHTPVAKHFNLSIADALALPINQWHDIEREAKLLASRGEKSEISELIDALKQFIGGFGTPGTE